MTSQPRLVINVLQQEKKIVAFKAGTFQVAAHRLFQANIAGDLFVAFCDGDIDVPHNGFPENMSALYAVVPVHCQTFKEQVGNFCFHFRVYVQN